MVKSTVMEKNIISTGWRDSGDFSNENPHQKVEYPDRNFPGIPPDMSGDTIIATSLKGLRCEESCSCEKRAEGWVRTIPYL